MELIEGPFKNQIELDLQKYEELPIWMKNSNIDDES
jgi:hypothetical protein